MCWKPLVCNYNSFVGVMIHRNMLHVTYLDSAHISYFGAGKEH